MNGTSTPKGRFVLRADSIRPYNPCGKLLPFSQPRNPVSFRAATGYPYNSLPIKGDDNHRTRKIFISPAQKRCPGEPPRQ